MTESCCGIETLLSYWVIKFPFLIEIHSDRYKGIFEVIWMSIDHWLIVIEFTFCCVWNICLGITEMY